MSFETTIKQLKEKISVLEKCSNGRPADLLKLPAQLTTNDVNFIKEKGTDF